MREIEASPIWWCRFLFWDWRTRKIIELFPGSRKEISRYKIRPEAFDECTVNNRMSENERVACNDFLDVNVAS